MPDIISYEFDPEVLVIDAGTLPDIKIFSHWVERGCRVICCDGAVKEFLSTGLPIWRIVGDGDSIPGDIREKYAAICRWSPDQETNDQTKSVAYAASKGLRRIAIIGATGRREDHTLGNISLLMEYMHQGLDVRIYTDYGVFIPLSDMHSFRCPPGTQVSIFNFGAVDLMSEGLKYPIRDFHSLWEGTLNEVEESTFRIFAKGNYMVFLNYPVNDKAIDEVV